MFVSVEFKGRLGNQLFQYVFLKYLKSRKSYLFYFFSNPHHAYLQKYFELEKVENYLLSSKLYSVVRFLPRILGFGTKEFSNLFYPKPVSPEGFNLYKGYFQTDFYLREIQGKVNLKIKRKYRERFEKQYGLIFKDNATIAVHVRLTDYKVYGENRKRDISIPASFYQEQLNHISDLERYKIFILSDDIAVAKEMFKDYPNLYFSENEEIIDFQIIMNADVAIISNSSFSWWAAYLSPKPSMVKAPKDWMGYKMKREHPKGIMTKRFDWYEVPSAF